MVRFDRPGISYIFCNIHPEMSAVVITLATPLFCHRQPRRATEPDGRSIRSLHSARVEREHGSGEHAALTREVTIGENASSLGVIRVPETNGPHMAHKNKYGRDYDDSTPNDPAYQPQR